MANTFKFIKNPKTTPYTPYHNSLAKRRNKTLLDMTWCMLKGKGLRHNLWGEVVSIATYVLNHYTTKKLHEVTLEKT